MGYDAGCVWDLYKLGGSTLPDWFWRFGIQLAFPYSGRGFIGFYVVCRD